MALLRSDTLAVHFYVKNEMAFHSVLHNPLQQALLCFTFILGQVQCVSVANVNEYLFFCPSM
jgi:hypothetical protein